MNELLKIIEQLQAELDIVFQRIDLNLNKAEKSIFENIISLVNQLQVKRGFFVSNVKNLKLINQFKSQLNQIIYDNADYNKVVSEFTKGLEISTSYINNYFATLVTTFKTNEVLFKELRKQVMAETIESLLGSGLDTNLVQQILSILRQNVTVGGSYGQLTNQIRAYLIGSNTPTKYAKQITNDALLGYERNYMQMVSNDLELSHYYYQGSKIESSRPFCQNRAGRFWRKAQIEEWAKLDWSGKRVGTTETSIFQYLGGYNCRHRLLPVSKEIYEANIK